MSLVRVAMKLKPFKSAILPSRQAGSWNHVIHGPPTGKIPYWKRLTFMGTFVVVMFTYPFYVTYMMYEWDVRDGNL